MVREFSIRDVKIGGKNPLVLIAGPDVLEDIETSILIARTLKKLTSDAGIGFIFKASYDKGNRGESASYRGPMMEKGLETLDSIRTQVDVPITTDAHNEEEVRRVAQVVDLVQIPAYLSMQTSLSIVAGETGKPLNVKKGQFLSPKQLAGIGRKIEATGNTSLMFTERGTFLGYGDLAADFRSLPRIREMGYPVVLDPTHIIRYPGTSSSDPAGGEPEYAPHLSRAGAAAGIDALFIETHPEPRTAACDGCSMMRLSYMTDLINQVAAIDKMVKGWDLLPRARDEHGFV